MAGRADGSTASITQSAAISTGTILQGISSGESISSTGSIVQTSVNNIANITQGSGANGSDYGSTATISQAGTGQNFPQASISQGVDASSDGDQATITQTSTVIDGFAIINQGVGTVGGGGSYSSGDKATITQSGNNNVVIINQNSTDLVAAGQSNGRANTATATQAAAVINSAALIDQGFVTDGSILQTNRNTASVEQAKGVGVAATSCRVAWEQPRLPMRF